MSRRHLIGLSLLLVACASPRPEQAILLSQLDALTESAHSASAQGQWGQAARQWQVLVAQRGALDDAQGQGLALLALAQAQAGLGWQDQARASLHELRSGRRFTLALQAEASYQLALLEMAAGQWAPALQLLDEATAGLGQGHSLLAAIANAKAREAVRRQDWQAVQQLAEQALKLTAADAQEQANSYYLQGVASMQLGSWTEAQSALLQALQMHQRLARKQAILADLQALSGLATLRGDPQAPVWQERALAAARSLGP